MTKVLKSPELLERELESLSNPNSTIQEALEAEHAVRVATCRNGFVNGDGELQLFVRIQCVCVYRAVVGLPGNSCDGVVFTMASQRRTP